MNRQPPLEAKDTPLKVGQVYFIPRTYGTRVWPAYMLIVRLEAYNVFYHLVSVEDDLSTITGVQLNNFFIAQRFLYEDPKPTLVKNRKIIRYVKMACV